MRRAYLLGGLAFAAAAVVWSCGLDDSAVISLDQDASTSDGSTFDSSVEDSGGDGSEQGDTGTKDSGLDAGFDAGPCARGDLPTCDDGTCSSATDICAPPVGAGWTVVNLISGSRPSCTTGYAAHDVVEVADGGPSACNCQCDAGATPTCETDHLTIGSGAICDTMTGHDLTAGCTDTSVSVGALTNFEAALTPRVGTCFGVGSSSFPDPDGGLSRECDLQDDAGAAEICANHRPCVAKPTTGHICIKHAAPAVCPGGFTLAYQSTVADSLADTRSCNACACDWTTNGCDNPTVTGYPAIDTTCSTTGDTISTSACSSAASLAYGSFGVQGTDVAPTCAKTDGGALDGGVTATNADVVCCSN